MGMLSDLIGTSPDDSAERAAEIQAGAVREVTGLNREIWEKQQEDIAPWQQTGVEALGGLKGNFMEGWQSDPGYDFRMSEGLKAVNARASARGGSLGGGTMKELTRYGQGIASQEYGNVYNRRFGKLSTLAGFGGNAMQTGVQGGSQHGQRMTDAIMGGANQQAAAIMGAAQMRQQAASSRWGAVGQVAGAAAAATSFSDKRLKTNIKPIHKNELDEMKKHLKAFAFNYKSDKHGKGDWVGVMAQDLEKSELGKTLVVHDKVGNKMIDINKVMSLFLATMAV